MHTVQYPNTNFIHSNFIMHSNIPGTDLPVAITFATMEHTYIPYFLFQEEKRIAKEEERLAKQLAKEEKKKGKREAKELLLANDGNKK